MMNPMWTIKGVSVEARRLAVACAKRRGMTVAEWIAEAIAAKLANQSDQPPSEVGPEAA